MNTEKHIAFKTKTRQERQKEGKVESAIISGFSIPAEMYLVCMKSPVFNFFSG